MNILYLSYACELCFGRERVGGRFDTGVGAGSIFHLMIKGYYQGQLVRTDNGWIFSNQKKGIISELSSHFGKTVERIQ